MQTVVIGTAGHIDHGKSALIKALTGIDPDRLKEEQARGITIDLGFAHLAVGDVQLAFVDVPGHERFVRTMLAGAGGIDAVILVVDANESVMPQTREHFDICRLLGITHGVVALTKTDLSDPQQIDRARLDVARLVAGSFLDGAPVLPVSVTSGTGIDALRTALAGLAGRAPRQHRAGVVRLPIDRAFTVKGFGAVVTGTLVSGSISSGNALVLEPGAVPVRVRGLQVHGRQTGRADAPQRVAVNLAGADASAIARGLTLATPESLAVTRRVDVDLQLLPSAAPLRHGARVRVHHGSSECFARVSLAATRAGRRAAWHRFAPGDAAALVESGGEAFARLRCETAMAVTRGDRLVLRTASPPATIGGATILDPQPLRTGVRHVSALARFERLVECEFAPAQVVTVVLEDQGERGWTKDDLVRRAGLDPAASEAAVASVIADGALAVKSRYFDAAAVLRLETRLRAELAVFHAAHPKEEGMTRGELRTRTAKWSAPGFFDAALDRLATQGVVRAADRVGLAAHRVSRTSDEEHRQRQVESAFRDARLTPPDPATLVESLRMPAAAVDEAIRAAVKERRLTRIGTLTFHSDALADLGKDLQTWRATQPGARVTVDVAFFKSRYGLTRKHAIPLLEWLDRERVTRRVGDVRIVL